MSNIAKEFIKYLIEQQGEDYVKEEGYFDMSFENVVLLESDHYFDFLGVEKNEF